MPRLALADGPAPRRRRAQRRRSARFRIPPAYLLCAALALVALAFERLDIAPPAELWGPNTRAEAPAERSAPQPELTPLGPVRVIDGDTLALGEERIRIANIDAPEMPPKAKCAYEAETALAAAARLRTLVAAEDLAVRRTGTDRYGRTLAHLYVNGADAGETLIAAGLVRPWEGRRRPWCLQVAA